MCKYQLFKQIPPKEFVEDVIKLYGPNGFDENYYFTLDDIIKNDIVLKLTKIEDSLKKYYLCCKLKNITNLTPKKTLTLLRQLLRPHNFKLQSCEKYKNGKKYILYNLKINTINISENNLTIKFE